MPNSTKNWLDYVAECKRQGQTFGGGSSKAGYLDLLKRRRKYSAAGSSGSKTPKAKSDANSNTESCRPRTGRGG